VPSLADDAAASRLHPPTLPLSFPHRSCGWEAIMAPQLGIAPVDDHHANLRPCGQIAYSGIFPDFDAPPESGVYPHPRIRCHILLAALSCPQCVSPSISRVEPDASIKDCLGKSSIKCGMRAKSCTVSAHS